MAVVAEFKVKKEAYLAEDGRLLQVLPAEWADLSRLKELYRWMVLTRAFDTKAIELQRTGRLGTYASSLGQEAASVGVGAAMTERDVFLPAFRDHGAQLVRGVGLCELFQYWGGDERGSDFAVPREDFPVSITVGGHAPHASGVALAFKLRQEPRVAVCAFGDGATSKGDVYEAMNVAGVWQLPAVFIVNNNQWAISTARADQTAASTLAQKAFAAGFGGVQVDGNDVVAVALTTGAAVERARSGGGPYLIECLTYRLSDHTTVDDASRYREDEEVSGWWQLDPVARLRAHLVNDGGWGSEEEAALLKSCSAEVEHAAERYLEIEPQRPEAIFDFLYADLPEATLAERAELQAQVGSSDA
jgi:pyruvate dehydrogenase E1 component alpha subunit